MMINDKKPFLCILFDLRSAFDKVQPKLMMMKLKDLCVNDSVINLLSSYLTNGTFSVSVDDAPSDSYDGPTGVPQGSCASPMLYAIFVLNLRESHLKV